MKKIPLTKGKFAIVDDEDYELLSHWKWYVNYHGYAERDTTSSGKTLHFKMHQVIMGHVDGKEIDHKNGDKLDNTRSNLRFCTHSQNLGNIGRSKHNKTGLKGVHWYTKYGCYRAQIRDKGKVRWLGNFKTAIEAHEAYTAAASKIHGEFARTI